MPTMIRWLDELEYRFINKKFWDGIRRRRIVSQRKLLRQDEGQVIQEIKDEIGEIKKSIALLLEDRTPMPEVLKKAEELFVQSLIERGYYLPAKTMVNIGQPRKVGDLNHREAAALWLGLFREQSFTLAGLWQAYLDLMEAIEDEVDQEGGDPCLAPESTTPDSVALPDIIREVFAPNGEEGELFDFVERVRNEAAAQDLILEECEDKSKIIAWVLETRFPPRRERGPIGGAKGERDERLGIDPRCHDDVARELRRSRCPSVSAVDQDILRAGNSLMDEYVRHVCDAIEDYGDDYPGSERETISNRSSGSRSRGK